MAIINYPIEIKVVIQYIIAEKLNFSFPNNFLFSVLLKIITNAFWTAYFSLTLLNIRA